MADGTDTGIRIPRGSLWITSRHSGGLLTRPSVPSACLPVSSTPPNRYCNPRTSHHCTHSSHHFNSQLAAQLSHSTISPARHCTAPLHITSLRRTATQARRLFALPYFRSTARRCLSVCLLLSAMTSVSAVPTAASSRGKSDDDVVVVAAYRSAIGKAKRGVFKDTYVEDLLAAVIAGTLSRSGVSGSSLGDIVVGSVLGSNVQRANEVRMGAFLAGVPASVPIHTVNRQCSSGLQAVAHVAAGIRSGYYDIGLACGLESMSSAEFKFTGSTNPRVFMNEQAKACMLPMGITSENVAAQFGIDRKTQDEFAVRSHTLAAAAIKEGRFKDEIIPVHIRVKDDKTGQERDLAADVDDGVRADTSFAGLSKLAPAFQVGGSTTAGNSSQVSDGAAAVLLTSRRYARQHSLPIMAVFRSFAVAGVPPEVMGIGPAFAIPMALQQAKLQIADIDLFEINEAFASQAVYCVQTLGIDINRVNVNGGAIAIGHPLGATGARATATLLHEMKRRGSRYGIVSMCIGSGMGAAAVYEMER